jgi:hypothetical protein
MPDTRRREMLIGCLCTPSKRGQLGDEPSKIVRSRVTPELLNFDPLGSQVGYLSIRSRRVGRGARPG